MDVGVFLTGAAVGGILDAVLNVAGFAEPLVLAGLAGAGALGLKKMADGAIGTRKPPPPRLEATPEDSSSNHGDNQSSS